MNTDFGLYNEILAAGPSPGTIFLILSKMKEEGEYKRVIQECIKALMIHPSDISLRKLLAETYLADGQVSMAENEFLKVAEYIHGLFSVYKFQAQVYLKQKRDEEAKEALRFYLAYYPDDDEAFDLLSSLSSLVSKSEPEAVEVDKKEESFPEYHEEMTGYRESPLLDIATPTLAEIYFKQGQIQDAKDMYEKIIAEHPDDEKSWQRLIELKASLAKTQIEGEGPTEHPVDHEPEEWTVGEPAPEKITSTSGEMPEESVAEDPVRIKTEQMVSLLGKWLEAIQGSAHNSLPKNQNTLKPDE